MNKLVVESVNRHLYKIGFTWLHKFVAAHPGLVNVHQVKPEHPRFSMVEIQPQLFLLDVGIINNQV